MLTKDCQLITVFTDCQLRKLALRPETEAAVRSRYPTRSGMLVVQQGKLRLSAGFDTTTSVVFFQ
jgi:hypothetical protein